MPLIRHPLPGSSLRSLIKPLLRFSTVRMDQTQQHASEPSPPPSYSPRYIDIGINLSDPIFRGNYHGNQRHPDDLQDVIDRARQVGCTKLIVTGSDIKSARDALSLAKEFPGTCFATGGIHPCSSSIFSAKDECHDEHVAPCDPDPLAPMSEEIPPDAGKSAAIIADLAALLAQRPRGLVAVGEFGLDYDRLHYCSRTLQLHSFEAQLRLAASLQPQLPLFLHSRAAHADFVRLLRTVFGDRLEGLVEGGVVHSFTGTVEEARELMDLGLYIGINGCSFKTKENCDVVREISLDRIMLETDGPWCEVRPSHEGWKYLVEKKAVLNGGPAAEDKSRKQKGQKQKEPEVASRFDVVKKEKWRRGAMVKGRNEPCSIERVAQIVAAIKGMSVEEVCEATWKSTTSLFGLDGS